MKLAGTRRTGICSPLLSTGGGEGGDDTFNLNRHKRNPGRPHLRENDTNESKRHLFLPQFVKC